MALWAIGLFLGLILLVVLLAAALVALLWWWATYTKSRLDSLEESFRVILHIEDQDFRIIIRHEATSLDCKIATDVIDSTRVLVLKINAPAHDSAALARCIASLLGAEQAAQSGLQVTGSETITLHLGTSAKAAAQLVQNMFQHCLGFLPRQKFVIKTGGSGPKPSHEQPSSLI
jgi:hypothetical protein